MVTELLSFARGKGFVVGRRDDTYVFLTPDHSMSIELIDAEVVWRFMPWDTYIQRQVYQDDLKAQDCIRTWMTGWLRHAEQC